MIKKPIDFEQLEDFESPSGKIIGQKKYAILGGDYFVAYVWWQDNQWYGEVWVWQEHRQTFNADTLEDLELEIRIEYGD